MPTIKTRKPASSPSAAIGAFDPEQVRGALRAGDTAHAEQLLRKRLIDAPNDADACVGLADLLLNQGKAAEGMALLRRALAVAPKAHRLRIRLAQLHQERGQFPAAITLVQQVPKPLRDEFDVVALEAGLLGQIGRREEEIVLYRRLLKERPKASRLWMTFGNVLNYAGRKEEAVRALRKALKLQPLLGEAWWSLANLKSFRFDERDLVAMRKGLRGNLTADDALHFHFALGKALEEREDYSESFDHYLAGNRLRAASLRQDEMGVRGYVDAAIATFTKPLMEHYQGAGCEAPDPIFVVGLQRSGSTLIEQILASHPMIEGTTELLTMQNLWDEIAQAGAAAGRDPFQQIPMLPPEAIRHIGEQYLERTRAYRLLGRPMFVDKLPANWMKVGLIRLVLPNAKIIDARRNPMACGFSNFKQNYASGVTFSYSQGSIGQFYRDYLRLMKHFDQVQPGAVHHVLNERLIEDPEGEVRRMLEYIGVPFDPSCLEFHKNKRAIHTPSAEQVRRPINRDGVDYWRHYEQWLGPLKASLGPALDDWQR